VSAVYRLFVKKEQKQKYVEFLCQKIMNMFLGLRKESRGCCDGGFEF
jgi:hypothetical protein